MKEYIESLPLSEQAVVEAMLSQLAKDGYLPPPFAKKLKGVEKLWELRPGRHRVMYFYYQGNKAILLHAFRKQSQKTPQRELQVALARIKTIEQGGAYG